MNIDLHPRNTVADCLALYWENTCHVTVLYPPAIEEFVCVCNYKINDAKTNKLYVAQPILTKSWI